MIQPFIDRWIQTTSPFAYLLLVFVAAVLLDAVSPTYTEHEFAMGPPRTLTDKLHQVKDPAAHSIRHTLSPWPDRSRSPSRQNPTRVRVHTPQKQQHMRVSPTSAISTSHLRAHSGPVGAPGRKPPLPRNRPTKSTTTPTTTSRHQPDYNYNDYFPRTRTSLTPHYDFRYHVPDVHCAPILIQHQFLRLNRKITTTHRRLHLRKLRKLCINDIYAPMTPLKWIPEDQFYLHDHGRKALYSALMMQEFPTSLTTMTWQPVGYHIWWKRDYGQFVRSKQRQSRLHYHATHPSLALKEIQHEARRAAVSSLDRTWWQIRAQLDSYFEAMDKYWQNFKAALVSLDGYTSRCSLSFPELKKSYQNFVQVDREAHETLMSVWKAVNPLVGFLASEIVDSQLLEAFAHDQEIDSRVLDGLNRELAGNSTEPKDLCRSEEAKNLTLQMLKGELMDGLFGQTVEQLSVLFAETGMLEDRFLSSNLSPPNVDVLRDSQKRLQEALDDELAALPKRAEALWQTWSTLQCGTINFLRRWIGDWTRWSFRAERQRV
ncbi:hypothetical protein AK812_SmicGene28454 [Symbiodinium microadriaticum]|uniref:Uncharacterized protein n=1 Tax=Symbiodinium microadriaticum TaxID=2951 RepID=A0A1Q9D4G3_SYMMI|nr:hypothetical protein AK812_SmicGene28454 [Symbiodinium microadriaticum]